MTNKERRQHRRFTVPTKTIALTPNNLGQVLDISLEGCAVKYIGEDLNISSDKYLDILMKKTNNGGCHLEKLPINIVWENSPDFSAFSTITVKKVGIEFRDLTVAQQQQLHNFIENYGVPEV